MISKQLEKSYHEHIARLERKAGKFSGKALGAKAERELAIHRAAWEKFQEDEEMHDMPRLHENEWTMIIDRLVVRYRLLESA